MSNITGGQDLEYAYKLASTLRWRTWPEEKPEDESEVDIEKVIAIKPKSGDGITSGFRFQHVYYVSATLSSIPFRDGDQWMYLSDLEVVR